MSGGQQGAGSQAALPSESGSVARGAPMTAETAQTRAPWPEPSKTLNWSKVLPLLAAAKAPFTISMGKRAGPLISKVFLAGFSSVTLSPSAVRVAEPRECPISSPPSLFRMSNSRVSPSSTVTARVSSVTGAPLVPTTSAIMSRLV